MQTGRQAPHASGSFLSAFALPTAAILASILYLLREPLFHGAGLSQQLFCSIVMLWGSGMLLYLALCGYFHLRLVIPLVMLFLLHLQIFTEVSAPLNLLPFFFLCLASFFCIEPGLRLPGLWRYTLAAASFTFFVGYLLSVWTGYSGLFSNPIDILIRFSSFSQLFLLGLLAWLAASFDLYSRYGKLRQQSAELSLSIYIRDVLKYEKALCFGLLGTPAALLINALLSQCAPTIYLCFLPPLFTLLCWMGECLAQMLWSWAAKRETRFKPADIYWLVIIIFCLCSTTVLN